MLVFTIYFGPCGVVHLCVFFALWTGNLATASFAHSFTLFSLYSGHCHRYHRHRRHFNAVCFVSSKYLDQHTLLESIIIACYYTVKPKYAALCTQTKCTDRRIITFMVHSLRWHCMSISIALCERLRKSKSKCLYWSRTLRVSCGPVFSFLSLASFNMFHHKWRKGQQNNRCALQFAHYAFSATTIA